MNKVILVLTLIVIGTIGYFMMQPRRDQPVIKLPDIIPQPSPLSTAELDLSSVQMEDIEVGQGDEVSEGKKVSVQYTGTLTDGTEFDSSAKNNNIPLVFTIGAGEMIPGFEQGVRGMRVGGTRRITIPPSLGYGDRANGDIPANSTLIFEVTLEKVE